MTSPHRCCFYIKRHGKIVIILNLNTSFIYFAGKYTIMVIGGCIGLFLFLIFFVSAYAYESHLRKRTLMADPEAQAELQKKKAEEKRRAAFKKAAKAKKGGWC